MEQRRAKALQAAGCLLCTIATWKASADLVGTEAEGGCVSGPVLKASFVALMLFVLALTITFAWPRVGAVTAVAASALCLPLYLLRTLPCIFRIISPCEWGPV